MIDCFRPEQLTLVALLLHSCLSQPEQTHKRKPRSVCPMPSLSDAMGTQNRSMMSSSNLVALATLWMSAVSSDAARRGAWGTCHHHRRHPSHFYRHKNPLAELVNDLWSVPFTPGSLMRQQSSIFGESKTPSPPFFEVSKDDDGTVELVIEVPGLSERDLTVEVENGNVLRVKGVRTQRKNGYLSQTEFDESIHLEDTVDVEKLKAHLSAGILTITVPRKPTMIKKIKIASDDPPSMLDLKTSKAPNVQRKAKKSPNSEEATGLNDEDDVEII
jgi:HSP20 family molecular chaperone IbpA